MNDLASEFPAVFTLREVKPGGLFAKAMSMVKNTYELQLYCQAPGSWHPTREPKFKGRYEFSRPAAWLESLLPYLTKMATVLHYAAPFAGVALDKEMAHRISATSNLVKELRAEFPTTSSDEMNTSSEVTRANGPALRQLQILLKEVDPSDGWGGLTNIPTPEGDVLWLCEECAQCYT